MKTTRGGWICLHRKILNWEWYDDINTFRLFIHLLLTVNHEDRKWHGVEIKRGQTITSLEHLKVGTRLSVHQVRVALNKLKMTGEVTSQSTPNYTIITIQKYEQYQDNDKLPDKRVANEWQTNDKRVATNNNINNVNHLDNINKKDSFVSFIDLFNNLVGSKYKGDLNTQRHFIARIKEGYTMEDFKMAIEIGIQNDFLMGRDGKNKIRYLTPGFVTRAEKLDNLLNQPQGKNNLKKRIIQ